MFNVEENESLLRLVVKAIEKGVGEDIRDYCMSTNKATNNAVRLMRSDNINTNLRDSVASDIVELKYFNRSAWTGCLLIDRQHKVTYTICTRRTLEGIPKKKDRRIPHYLQSILYVQNANVMPVYEQMSLGDYASEVESKFTDDVYIKDYNDIMKDDLVIGDDYMHYVIVYEAEHLGVTSVAVKLLDPNFRTAKEYSLDYLLKPDFSELTIDETEYNSKDSHDLINVKVSRDKMTSPKVVIVKPKNMEEMK